MQEGLIPFEWDRLFSGLAPEMYYLEVGLRVISVFFFLLLIFRLLGKRSQRNLSPMQNILMISLGTAVGDVMLFPDVPLFYSFFVLALVSALVYLLSVLKLKYQKVQDYVVENPVILVENGKLCVENLKENRMTEEGLYTMLRVAGIEYLEELRYAIFEPTGEMSVFVYSEGEYQKRTSLIDIINRPGKDNI